MKFYERLPWKPFRSWRRKDRALVAGTHGTQRGNRCNLSLDAEFYSLPAEPGVCAGSPDREAAVGAFEAHEMKKVKRCGFSQAYRRFGIRRLRWCRSRKRGSTRADPALVEAAGWLADMQILGGGDWQVKIAMPNPVAGPSNFAMTGFQTWTILRSS